MENLTRLLYIVRELDSGGVISLRTSWSTVPGSDTLWIEAFGPSHEVQALFSFRIGGTSTTPFSSLNVGLHVGDDADAVLCNRSRIAELMDVPKHQWVFGEQVHGAKVAVVNTSNVGAGVQELSSAIADVDALVTNEPGVTLGILTADCVPVLFWDRRRHIAAAAHSGWKGTVGHISARVIDTMRQEFGSHPEDVEVWLGPSIRQCCYEVDGHVAGLMSAAFGERVLRPRFYRPGHYLLNLQACITQDLQQTGVSRVIDTGVCTACNRHVLFSHRADMGKTGRQMALIRLR